MEGRLVPWCHFVPLDSPQDVDAKLRWCRDNPEHVQAIVANATAFMKQFAHEEDEREIPAQNRAAIPGECRVCAVVVVVKP